MTLKEYKPGTAFPGVIGLTTDQSSPAWPEPLRAKEGTPNVLLSCWMTLAMASSAATAAPSRHPTSTAWPRMACAITTCTPLRSARPRVPAFSPGATTTPTPWPASPKLATGYPGYNGNVPFENGFLSEMLLTAGLQHLHDRQVAPDPIGPESAAGPYDRWPLGRGFERFYGFLGGDTHQYYPDLVYDNHQVEPPKTPEEGYHLTEDLVDKAIQFIVRCQAGRARQAVLPAFLPRRHARAASRAQGMGGQVQGQVRRRLGCLPREGLCAAERAGHRPGRRRTLASRPGRAGLG